MPVNITFSNVAVVYRQQLRTYTGRIYSTQFSKNDTADPRAGAVADPIGCGTVMTINSSTRALPLALLADTITRYILGQQGGRDHASVSLQQIARFNIT